MKKNGYFDVIAKINRLYELLSKNFTFKIQEDNLKVYPPDQISTQEQLQAKEFIRENRLFIITTLKNNSNLLPILHIKSTDAVFPLSFAQERLWFIEKFEQGTNAYHIPLIFKLSHDVN